MGQPVGRHTEDASLYGFGEGLKTAPDAIGEMATAFEELARQAEDDQPTSSRLSEKIREVANTLRRAADEAGEWHSTFRSEHEADVERVENPRKGSQHVESRADVGRAMRDT